jgi:hypothetical protein
LRFLVEHWVLGADWNRLVRQEDAEAGAADGIAFCPDAPGMLVHDGSADGKAKTGSALLPGI